MITMCKYYINVFNEVAGVVVFTGNSVIYIIFCHSIINETRWLEA